MLFTKDLTQLLLVPEGMEATAYLPNTTEVVPVGAFSHSAQLSAVSVGENCNLFTSENGILYNKDKTTLIAAPVGIGDAIVIPNTVTSIGPRAFLTHELTSIVVQGKVQSIDPTAFSDSSMKNATVALSVSDNYVSSLQIWEQAGFLRFQTPAKPGDIQVPEQKFSGFSYEILADYTLSVAWMGAEDPVADLVIPSTAEIGGVIYRVSQIADNAFVGCEALQSLLVPSSVTSIGNEAFSGCSQLASVLLSENLTSIGDSTFEGTALTEVILPQSVSVIGDRTFAGCTALSRIVSLGDMREVPDAVIADCQKVSVLTPYRADGLYSWNPGLPSTGNHIEAYGVALEPDSLDLTIGSTAGIFEGGVSEVPEGCELSYAYDAKCVSVNERGTVRAVAEGKMDVLVTLALGEEVLSRTSRQINVKPAPQKAAEPIAVTMPLSRLGALGGDAALYALPAPFDYAVGNTTLLCTVLSQDNVLKIGTVSVAVKQGSTDTSFSFPATVSNGNGITYAVKTIAPFSERTNYCGSFTNIVIPDSVETIAPNAFLSCPWLAVVTFGSDSQLKTIGAQAFCGCSNLTEFPFGNLSNLATIGNVAFQDSKLTSVVIPPSVTLIGSWSFASISSLASVVFENSDGSPGFGGPAFIGSAVASFTIAGEGSAYKIIDGMLFSGDGKTLLQILPAVPLETYVVPENTTALGQGSISNNTLKSLTVPSSINSISRYAVYSCSSLSSVVYEGYVGSLNFGNFVQCLALSSITSYGDITSIDPNSETFNGVDKSKVTITLPDGKVNGRSLSDRQKVWSDVGFSLFETAADKVAWFDSTGGAKVAPQRIAAGTSAQRPASPEPPSDKAGYVVADWYEDAACAGTAWDFSSPLSTSTTLYARWAPGAVFHPSNGDADVRVAAGSDGRVVAPSFSKTGYVVEGWYEDAGLTQRFDFSTAISAGKELWAKWKPITYKVRFNANQTPNVKVDGFTADLSLPYDSTGLLPESGFTCAGYSFQGWNTDPKGQGKSYAPGDSVINLATEQDKVVTLYAQWKGSAYTVSFDAHAPEGATVEGSLNDATLTFGLWQNLPANAFKCKGFSFRGWTVDQAGTSELFLDKQSVQNIAPQGATSVRLYAQWDEAYNVTVPIDPVVKIDAKGAVTADPTTFFRSNNATTVAVAKIKSSALSGAQSIFPDCPTDGSLWKKVRITLADASDPEFPLAVPVNGESLSTFIVPSNSELPISIGLSIANDTALRYSDASLACFSLSYEFSVVK